jgi:hypothetical protein
LAGLGNSVKNAFFGSCGQDIVALCRQSREDFDYLLVGFAGAINDLRETLANLAMVVNAGKTEVLERQMTKLLDGLVDSYFTVFNLL